MSDYNDQMVAIMDRYINEVDDEPSSLTDVVDWALDKGLLRAAPRDIRKVLRDALADSLRQDKRFDGKRWYRAKHSVRTHIGGVQLSLWADIDRNASHSFMQKSAGQRRRGMVNDAFQLKMDLDHYNEANPGQEPIPLILDLTDDVAEMEAAGRFGKDDDEAA